MRVPSIVGAVTAPAVTAPTIDVVIVRPTSSDLRHVSYVTSVAVANEVDQIPVIGLSIAT